MAKQNSNKSRKKYLLPYVIFGAAGIILIISSFLSSSYGNESAASLLLALGASISVVVFVEIIWKIIGGDPITNAITSLWQATNLLKDLEESGIKSVKAKRSDLDNPGQKKLWYDLIINATQIDIMGHSMRTQITKEKDLMKAIEIAVQKKGCKVRVLTYPPFKDISKCNPVLLQRINEEKRLPGGKSAVDRFRSNIDDTRSQFLTLKNQFKHNREREKCIQIKASSKINLYYNIIRIDDRMWVSHYSGVERGGGNPVFEISGMHSTLFHHFGAEFNHIWEPPPPLDKKRRKSTSLKKSV
jgi:hypothetical protein